jgi:hypothetical protein
MLLLLRTDVVSFFSALVSWFLLHILDFRNHDRHASSVIQPFRDLDS